MSNIILGTVQLGLKYGVNNSKGKPSTEKSIEILHTAKQNGIKILDTALAYGNSETVIGEYHAKFPNEKFKIISKIGNADVEIEKEIRNSIDKLKIERFYGYMFHNYETFKQNSDYYKELQKAKTNQLTEKIGISLYKNAEIEDIIDNYKFDFIQVPFNLLDNDFQKGRLLEKVKNKGIEVHIRSAFLQGLFFMDLKKIPNNISILKPQIEEIKKINIPIQQLSLQYPLSKPYIDYIVIGVDTKEQLLSNIKICNDKISEDAIKMIDNIKVKNTEMLNPSNW